MGRRLGQAAIEYVTQYGWMLVAASIVGGTVYTQIPTACNLEAQGFEEDVEISQVGIDKDQELLMSFRRKTVDEINIKQVRLNGSETIYQNQSFRLPRERSASTQLTEVERSTSCNNYQLTIVYDKGPVPSIKQTVDLRLPVSMAKVLKPFLKTIGGEVNSISTSSTILATNDTVCIGGNCPSNDKGKYKDVEYVNRSGDQMTGTLYTNNINWSCIGGNCPIEEGSLKGYVSEENQTLDGTLNVTEIKPDNQLCMGETC